MSPATAPRGQHAGASPARQLERAARWSRASAAARADRLRSRAFKIAQASVGAGLAYFVAHDLLGHPLPFFAPVVVLVCLGMTYGQRLRRIVDITVGSALGIALGDVFGHLAGSGAWQVAVVVLLGMSLAALTGTGQLLMTQAGIQALLVTLLVVVPGGAVGRWVDALVGGAVALVVATAAPSSPLRRPRAHARRVMGRLAELIETTAQGLAERDERVVAEALRRARETEQTLEDLRMQTTEGMAVLRLSPWRRRHREEVLAIHAAVPLLDRLARNLRVLVRRADVALLEDERVPDRHIELLLALADSVRSVEQAMGDPEALRHARADLGAVARASLIRGTDADLSAEVVRAQVRSMLVDLYQVTGLPPEEARARVPSGRRDRRP